MANVRTIWDESVEIPTTKKFGPLKYPVSDFELPQKMNVKEPDLIFVMESFRKIRGLNRFKCPKAFDIQDPHIDTKRYRNYSYLEDYDYVFCRNKDYLNEFKGSIWLPESFDPDIILGMEEIRDIPISFIGNRNHPERAKMLSMLETKFGLQNPFAYNHEMAKILRRSKIVFNHTRNGDLNNRVFDALGSGAMLITQRIGNGLFDLFKEGEHLVTYRDIKELENLTERYLYDEDERERIADFGQTEAILNHTNLDRAKTVLETCLGKNEAVEERWDYLKERIYRKNELL